MSTKALNPRCKINFGNLTYRILILQTTCFTAYLHDLGTKSRFSFRILILQKKDETNVYKCLQKPLIHDAKLILEILLFGSWSSKLPSFECFCMICADFQKLTSCGIMGRKFLRQSPIPCENSGFSVLRVGPTRQQTEESVKGYMWNYSSTCLFWSPTDATVAIIMHCSHGQKNYGNMSIEKLSPLSGNK